MKTEHHDSNQGLKEKTTTPVYNLHVCFQRESVPAILALAQAYMILKHTAKARIQLKRLIKVNWSLADAEELEKGWILLSDIYCTTGKYDLATEQLRRCLRYNKVRGCVCLFCWRHKNLLSYIQPLNKHHLTVHLGKAEISNELQGRCRVPD